MNITDEEIKQLEYIDKGTFGSIYSDGKNKYKIYHPYVKDWIGYDYTDENPCLRKKGKSFNKFNKRNKKIKNTDVSMEPVFIDGKFSGVSQLFIPGNTLYKHINDRFDIKIARSRELIDAHSELINNRIYPCDMKLNNIVVDKDGNTKIIDLDDVTTHITSIPNVIFKHTSLLSLKNTLYTYLKNNQVDFGYHLLKHVESYPYGKKFSGLSTYDSIINYINYFSIERKIVIIDYSNIEKINYDNFISFINDNELNVVISFNKKDLILNRDSILDKFKILEDKGITVYDVISYDDKFEYAEFDYVDSNNISDGFVYGEDGIQSFIKK